MVINILIHSLFWNHSPSCEYRRSLHHLCRWLWNVYVVLPVGANRVSLSQRTLRWWRHCSFSCRFQLVLLTLSKRCIPASTVRHRKYSQTSKYFPTKQCQRGWSFSSLLFLLKTSKHIALCRVNIIANIQQDCSHTENIFLLLKESISRYDKFQKIWNTEYSARLYIVQNILATS